MEALVSNRDEKFANNLETPVIISDIDGVLCDLMAGVQDWLWKMFEVYLPLEFVTHYDWVRCLDRGAYRGSGMIDEKEVRAWVEEEVYKNEDVLLGLKPYWDVLYALNGCKINIVSGRPRTLSGTTLTWLRRYGLSIRSLTLTSRNQKSTDMLRLIEAHSDRPIYVLEDDGVVCDELRRLLFMANFKSSVRIFLIERPWNANWGLTEGNADCPIVTRLSERALRDALKGAAC